MIQDFNPRSPHRERHTLVQFICRTLVYFNPRSPHRERPFLVVLIPLTLDFNPRSPHRERRLVRNICLLTREFQSTLPSQGATVSTNLRCMQNFISIHAPLTGSDMVFSSLVYSPEYFNPRSPHRERLNAAISTRASLHFNPRSPHRERLKPDGTTRFISISIHAPLTGSDLNRLNALTQKLKFQSTLPSQGATIKIVTFRHCKLYFNPRSPHRERRRYAQAV